MGQITGMLLNILQNRVYAFMHYNYYYKGNLLDVNNIKRILLNCKLFLL